MSSRRRSLAFPAVLLAAFGAPALAQLSLPPDYVRRQLSPAGESGSTVGSYPLVDPRGEWVVFVGDAEIDGLEAVYSIRRNGSELHRLSAYGAPSSITNVQLSGDGRHVVYRGDLDTDGRPELWSARLDGTPASAVKLNVPVIGGGVANFAVSEEEGSSQVAYLAETATGRGMWSVPVVGPAAVGIRIDPPITPGELLGGPFLSPDGDRAVLLLVDFTLGTSRIWSVPSSGPAGSGLFLLEGPANGCIAFTGFATGASSRFVWLNWCDVGGNNVLNQIWSVPIEGPAAAAQSLAGSFVPGGAITGLDVDPHRDRLVFIADKTVDERFDLWSVDVTGTAASLARLNPTPVANGDVVDAVVSPDGTRVAYVADQTSNEAFRAYSVPIAGPSTEAVALVSGVTPAGSDVEELDFTSDSSAVVLRGDLTVNDRFDLYSVPADGSETQDRITNDESIPGATRSVGGLWRLHPDGRRVDFTVDVSAPGDQRRLYEQRLAPRYIQDARLNGEPVAGGAVAALVVYPDSAGTLYSSDETADGNWQLFTVDSRLFGDGFEDGDSSAWADVP